MTENIQPVIRIFPEEYFEGEKATMNIVVFNANPSSEAKLDREDWFEFTFDPKWNSKANLTLVSKTIFLNSPSRAVSPNNFALSQSVRLLPGTSQLQVIVIRVQVIKPTRFPPGEGFGFTLKFITPGAPGFGMVSAANSQGNKKLDPITPAFTLIGFLEPEHNVSSATTVNIANGGTVNANDNATITTNDDARITATGDTTITANDDARITTNNHVTITANDDVTITPNGDAAITVQGGTINAESGSTVNVLPGANVMLPPGTVVPAAPSLPAGPNFLQIAANKWYEAGSVQHIRLSASPGTLCFDGQYLWIAMTGYDKLGRVETSSGALMEVPLSLQPRDPSLSPDPLPRDLEDRFDPKAMVYDGEKFWISGMGVIRPDGLILTNVSLPSGGSNLVFDGKSVLAGNGGLAFDGRKLWRAQFDKLISTDQGSGHNAAYDIPFVPSALVYDGSYLWLANPTDDTVAKYDLEGKLAGGPYPVGASMLTPSVVFNPRVLLFDGAHIWVGGDGGVTKLRASNGSSLGTFHTDPVSALAFDGINIWVGSSQQRSLTRL